MSSKWLNRPVVLGKAAVIAIGIGVVVLGLYSHFKSAWTADTIPRGFYSNDYGIPRKPSTDPATLGTKSERLYKVCDSKRSRLKTCPSIWLERCFIYMIIVCFVLSLVSLIADMKFNMQDSRRKKLIDAVYNCVAVVILLIAGIMYIVSAVQIKSFISSLASDRLFANYVFLQGGKITAGVLTIIQAFLCGAVTIIIIRA